jgi:hypothetical protein
MKEHCHRCPTSKPLHHDQDHHDDDDDDDDDDGHYAMIMP